MSVVDLLFPQEQLEDLGNKWHEPAPKRRKVESGKIQQPSNPTSDANQRRHRLSAPTPYLYGRQSSLFEHPQPRGVKRSNSDSVPVSVTGPSSSTQTRQSTTNNSCLPSFIEPSILKNYLRHLHPKDSHRYQSPKPESRSRRKSSLIQPDHTSDDSASSPGSLITDSSSSPASSDTCPTPAAVCDQFRSGPFGHIFDGMRLTDNERDLVEDLLSPVQVLSQDEALTPKHKLDDVKVELAPENYNAIDPSRLERMFPTFTEKDIRSGWQLHSTTHSKKNFEVHSSGLSPAMEAVEEEDTTPSHRGIVVYDYDAVSVDDFFDLEEAST